MSTAPTTAATSTGTGPNLPVESWPLVPPPPGRTVNRVHPESNACTVHVAAGVCIPLIVIFASIRLYNKVVINRGRTWDDYTFMLASVCAITYISLVVALLDHGPFGFHIWDLVVANIKNSSLLLALVLEGIYGPFIWLIKLSVLLMYLQLFHPFPWARRMAWLGIIVTALFYFSTTIAKFGLCAPRGRVSYIEAFSAPRCNNTKKLGLVTGYFNVLSDIYLLALPVPCVWKLSLKPKKKLGVIAGFMTGISIAEMTCGLAFLCGPSIASIAKRHNEAIKAWVKRSIGDDRLQGKSVRLTRFGDDSTTSRKQHRHGHKASADSDTQLHTTTSDSATVDEISSQPKY
ncbi:MAG: hypothetical protein LQ348_005968 [Seirophora lacunosa]|nr:MAG: hypothetical protein LQ348_005968 [Seirophora lacunosa]